MGSWVDVKLVFAKEKPARAAVRVIEGMVKLFYVLDDGDSGLPPADGLTPAERCLRDEELLAGISLHPGSCLSRLTRDRTRVELRGCHDVAGVFSLPEAAEDEFFPQLCMACALRMPRAPFTGYFRHEETVSGSVQLTRANWDGSRLRMRQVVGDMPFDEDRWDTWDVYDWVLSDGRFEQVQDARSPLAEHCLGLLVEAEALGAAGDAHGALRLIADAMAIPGCEDRGEAVEVRSRVGESLRRRGVRAFVCERGEVPEGLVARCVRKLDEMPLDVGTHVLRREGSFVRDVDTADGRVCAELDLAPWGSSVDVYLLDGFRLVELYGRSLVGRHLVMWDYEGE